MKLYNLIAIRTDKTTPDDLVRLLFSSDFTWYPCIIHYDREQVYTGGFITYAESVTAERYVEEVTILGNCGVIVVPEKKISLSPLISGVHIITRIESGEDEHIWFDLQDAELYNQTEKVNSFQELWGQEDDQEE